MKNITGTPLRNCGLRLLWRTINMEINAPAEPPAADNASNIRSERRRAFILAFILSTINAINVSTFRAAR